MSEHKLRIKQYILFDRESKFKGGTSGANDETESGVRVRKILSRWQSIFISRKWLDQDCLPDCLVAEDRGCFTIFLHAGLERLPDGWSPERVWVWKSKEGRLEEYLSLNPGPADTDGLGAILVESNVERFSLTQVLTKRAV